MALIQKTRQSREDYAAIHAFVFETSPQNADMILRQFDEKLLLLASNRFLGKPRPELADRLRSWSVHRFVLFYRPTDDGIELMRVLHGSMDIAPRFFA